MKVKMKKLIKGFHRGEKGVTMPLPEYPGYAVQPGALQLVPEVIAGKYNFVRTDIPGNTLPVDKSEEESLVQAPLFDTGPYEVPVDDKVGIAAPRGSDEAKQFAQQPRIRLFNLGERPVANIATEEKPSLSKEEPAKAEEKSESLITAKPPTKHPRYAVQPEALWLIPEVIARGHSVVPLAISDNTLEVAMADPANTVAIQVLSALSGMKIEPVAADAGAVRETIDFNYKKAGGEIEKQPAQDPDLIFEEAAKANASNIDTDLEETGSKVRYRIDGILHDLMSLPPNIRIDLLTRIKNLPVMNVADRLRSQDGQYSSKAMGRNTDVRVASLRTNQTRGSERGHWR